MTRRPVALASRIGVSLALLLFAALAVASGFDRMTLQVPALGRWVPSALQAQAARSNAALALTREQPRAALAEARRAVAADPVDPASTALLGTAYLMNAQPAQSEAAFRVAARFGWREAMTQVYWYEAALQGGDLPRAVDRADALLRTHPALPGIDEVLAPLESTPEGRAALIVRMADRPNWLATYLHPQNIAADEIIERRSLVLTDLAAAGTQLGCAEVTLFVTKALEAGARRAAERVWTGHCPGADLGGELVDGGLERVGRDDATPFGWRTIPSGDVVVRPVDRDGNRVLQVRNRGTVSRLVLRQAVSLEPGLYRLTGKSAAGRMAGSLGCGGEPERPSLSDGDMAAGGQLLRVTACPRLELGLWLRPGTDEVELDAIALKKVG